MRSLWKPIDLCCMNCKNFRWKKKCLCTRCMKLCQLMVSLKRWKKKCLCIRCMKLCQLMVSLKRMMAIPIVELNTPIPKSMKRLRNSEDIILVHSLVDSGQNSFRGNEI